MARFDDAMSALRVFVQTTGSARVPRAYLCADGFRLGVWVHNMRGRYRRNDLTPAETDALEAVGFEWLILDRARERDAAVAALASYRNEHGSLPPVGYVTDQGFALGAWLDALKYRARAEPADGPAPARHLLVELGVPLWQREHQSLWEAGIRSLRDYIDAHGDSRVPFSWRDPEGLALGVWVNSRRADAADGRLRPDRRAALDALGFEWVLGSSGYSERRKAADDRHFHQMVHAMVLYAKEHGHCRVPVRYVTADGVQLGRWAIRQRREYARGRLDLERIVQLENVGFPWKMRGA